MNGSANRGVTRGPTGGGAGVSIKGSVQGIFKIDSAFLLLSIDFIHKPKRCLKRIL